MLPHELRAWLDLVYLLSVGLAVVFLAYQGWRKAPEARVPALALGLLLLQGAYRLVVSAWPGRLGLLSQPTLVPVLDRTLATAFLILLVYGLVRPLFPAYRPPLTWLLVSHLAFLAFLSVIVALDYPQHLGPSGRFAGHWGAVAYEVYQIPLIVAGMGLMLAVYRGSRSSYARLVLIAFGLWLVGHVVHLAGLLTGQDTPATWGILLRLFEIGALALVAAAVVLPDPARRSLAARYLADADVVVRRLQAEVERLVAAKAALEERERLARELHDSVTQALFSIELNAGAAEALLDKDPAKTRQRLDRLRAAAHEALGDLRSLIAELRPPALEGKGLVEAVEAYAATLEERAGIAVTLQTRVEGDLDHEAEVELFRIAYEALTNIVKHAQARHAWIELDIRPPAFRLRVADDGVGLPAKSEALTDGRTFGLSGMRERAAVLGARLEIGSRVGGGAEVLVER